MLKDLAEETLKPNRDFIKPIEDEPKTENVNIFELFTTESSDNDQVVELDYTSNFINSKKSL